MEKNKQADHLVLPYLEEELQPKGMPLWVFAIFIAFVLGALLFPFYAWDRREALLPEGIDKRVYPWASDVYAERHHGRATMLKAMQQDIEALIE